MPLTMSSMRSSILAESIAVFTVCCFTANGSHTPSARMSVTSPVSPLRPHGPSGSSAWRARSFVSVRITLMPQFCASVRGITSIAWPAALYGHASTPAIAVALSARLRETAISHAPPPGTSRGSITMLRATPIASTRLRSTSLRMSRDAPRSITVHALGCAQSTTNEKNSSPILTTSKRPAPVPMSASRISSVRCTIVAPAARAMRLLSVLRSRRMADTPALVKKCAARSERPFSVTTRSGLNAMIWSHIFLICSSSALSSAAQSSSLVISTLVWFSPFLYSSGQSSSRMRGLAILRRMRPGTTTSLLNMTPLSTRHSSIAPPGIFSIFA
mmetsp:Transcript_29671/g.87811  ORF Transcript_29671/g.87811 Transcript_29671/m.87811 type:complete len:330 (+) Transcript_29671:4066-5055(+)